MTTPSTSCIDLFCGAGGLTYGLVESGIRVKAGIDIDPACKFPYEANNRAKFIESDVSQLDVRLLDDLFGKSKFKILAGCAPCQPFSTYAHRYDAHRDGNWSLLYQFSKLVSEVLPDVVTMENVAAVAKHKVYEDFEAALKGAGYSVWAKVVNCSDYGVPQLRRRLVMLASRHGPIDLIAPTHSEPKKVKSVISRLRPIAAGEAAPRDPLHASASLSPLNLKRIKASKPGGTWRDWPQALVAKCHKESSGRTYSGVYGRMDWEKPAPTMTTQCYGYGNGRFGHPEQDRAISLREAAMFQGFPRAYAFVPPGEPVQFSKLGRLIGNAVPVDLARAIGGSIRRHLRTV